jgi:hypothetical protein
MEIKAKRATALTNPTAATMFLEVDNSANAAVAFIETGVDCFYVRAKGTATGGTTTNFTPRIMYTKQTATKVTSATDANNLAFFSGGAAAYNTASGPWVLEVLCTYDPVNKILSGVGWGVNGSGGAAVTTAAATPVAVGQDANIDLMAGSSAGNAGFGVDALFSASNAGNKCTLETLHLDIIWLTKTT